MEKERDLGVVVFAGHRGLRFGEEDEDEDEDEALCFRHNEIFKLFRLQLGRETKLIATTLSRHHCHGFEHAHHEQKLDLFLVLESKAR